MVEHYISTLPLNPKNCVMWHQQATLEGVVVLMEAYISAEAGAYLIPKMWKAQNERKVLNRKKDWTHKGALERWGEPGKGRVTRQERGGGQPFPPPLAKNQGKNQ